MRLGLARCLLLYVMYGEYLQTAMVYASFGEFDPLWALLWGMCNPFVIAVGEEIG